MQKPPLMAGVLAALVMLPLSPAAQPTAMASPGPGWVHLVLTIESDYWVHEPTRVRTGSIVGLWVLDNAHTLQPDRTGAVGGSWRSIRSFHEYDCSSRQRRSSELSFHTGPNGSGRTISTVRGPGAWERVPPETALDRIWAFACGR